MILLKLLTNRYIADFYWGHCINSLFLNSVKINISSNMSTLKRITFLNVPQGQSRFSKLFIIFFEMHHLPKMFS